MKTLSKSSMVLALLLGAAGVQAQVGDKQQDENPAESDCD